VNGRRRLEVFILAFGAVFLAVLVYSFRPGRRPSSRGAAEAPQPPAASEAGLPMTVSKGFDYAMCAFSIATIETGVGVAFAVLTCGKALNTWWTE